MSDLLLWDSTLLLWFVLFLNSRTLLIIEPRYRNWQLFGIFLVINPHYFIIFTRSFIPYTSVKSVAQALPSIITCHLVQAHLHAPQACLSTRHIVRDLAQTYVVEPLRSFTQFSWITTQFSCTDNTRYNLNKRPPIILIGPSILLDHLIQILMWGIRLWFRLLQSIYAH